MAPTRHTRDEGWAGGRASALASVDWTGITVRLADLLGAVRRGILVLGPQEGSAQQRGAWDATAREASAQAQMVLGITAQLPQSEDAEWLDHPLVRLARAYAEAFDAVRYVIACLEQQPEGQGHLSEQLAELAERAASALVQAVGLVFGQNRLGTIANTCDYIGGVEGQADDLLRRGIDTLLRNSESLPGWDRRHAEALRTLLALEALTDRCEDIADALLLVRYVL